jgi:hypothetical protein
LDELKEKQRGNTGMSEEEAARVEEEKKVLLSRLEALEKEREQQKAQLECLRGLVGAAGAGAGAGGAAMEDGVERRKKRPKHRDTWYVKQPWC